LNLKKESTVEVRLVDLAGKQIAARNYGSMNGSSTIQLNTAELTAGVYVVEVTINNEKMIKRLIIE